MLPSVIIIVLIAAIIFTGRTHNEPITSTTSAIVEIWSGHCRQACRHSENNMEPHHDDRNLNQRGAGPSSGCVCSSCPCMLIDNMITTVSPAMACYCHFIAYLSDCILAFASVLNEMLNQIVRVLENRITCQQNAQGILSDTVSYAEERRPRKKEHGFEDTFKEKTASKVSKKKAIQDDRDIKNSKDLRGTPSAISDTSSSGAAPPYSRDQTKKMHKPESAFDTSAAVEPERKVESRAVMRPETGFGASAPLEPEGKEALRPAAKSETYRASEPLNEPKRKESKSLLDRESKDAPKKQKSKDAPEPNSEPPKPQSGIKMKPDSKLSLKPETGTKLKPDSRLTLKADSITKLKPESKSKSKSETKLKLKTESTLVKPGSSNAATNVSEAGTSSKLTKEENVGTTTSRTAEPDLGTTETQGVCRKCIERGKTCVGGCPRAKLTEISSERPP